MRSLLSAPAETPEPKLGGSLAVKWQRTLLLAIPCGVTAFLVGWLLEGPSGQSNPLDLVSYPLMAVLLVLLEIILAYRARALQSVVLVIVVGASAFFILKLSYLLFVESDLIRAQREMTETFYWIPITYLLSYLIPGVRGGRLVTFVFTGEVLLLSLVYIALNLSGDIPWNMVYALIELNLADGVLLALTLTFISLKEDQIRTQTYSEALERMAGTDRLTGLPNRLTLERELVAALDAAREAKCKVALLFIDLDRFKVVNDTLGHQAGDQLLEQVAQRLKQGLRHGDFLARISGDEFIVMLPRVDDLQTVASLAQRLLAALVMPFYLHNQRFSISASIGSSIFPDDAASAEALLKHADSAMYKVKKSGKNGFQSYEAASGRALEKGRELEKDLRTALLERQFSLEYQPIIDLKSNEIVKFEALLRWEHPRYGSIAPAEFVRVAEEAGFIASIGGWVLDEACRQAKEWQRHRLGAFKVAVNVSPLQFLQTEFFESVLGALTSHGLAPEYLELELTESVVMHSIEQVEVTLRRLRRLGITLAIDDFGTGYSSLAYLRDLPIDVLKIDRSFVRDLSSAREEPQFALALIQAILSLGTHLDLSIVAEGIETEAQLRLVRTLGCHAAQGYYLAKPMPPAALGPFLRAQRSQPKTELPVYFN